MKQHTITTYLFEELPKEVQEKAFLLDQKFLYRGFYNSELRATLAAFEKIFNISVYRWEVDSSYYHFDFVVNSFTAANNANECIKNPLRLAAFVYNNYARYIRKGKYYSTGDKWENGQYKYKSRRSRVIFTYDDCPLTGVCWDQNILQPVIDCLTYRRFFDTYDDLITTCLNEFFETWRAAREYAESFEFYAEEAAANEWEYLPTGERWLI